MSCCSRSDIVDCGNNEMKHISSQTHPVPVTNHADKNIPEIWFGNKYIKTDMAVANLDPALIWTIKLRGSTPRKQVACSMRSNSCWTQIKIVKLLKINIVLKRKFLYCCILYAIIKLWCFLHQLWPLDFQLYQKVGLERSLGLGLGLSYSLKRFSLSLFQVFNFSLQFLN